MTLSRMESSSKRKFVTDAPFGFRVQSAWPRRSPQRRPSCCYSAIPRAAGAARSQRPVVRDRMQRHPVRVFNEGEPRRARPDELEYRLCIHFDLDLRRGDEQSEAVARLVRASFDGVLKQ